MSELWPDEKSGLRGIINVSYDYDYPDGLDLSPKSELHKKIVNRVMNRAKESSDIISRRYSDWRKIDETLTAYISLDEAEKKVQGKDKRIPVSVVIPQSYATLEILLTYLTAALLERPYFRYEGKSPEDVVGAILLGQCVDAQCQYYKVGLSLHTMFRDSLAYGMGIVAPIWNRDYAMVTSRVKKTPSLMDLMLGKDPGYRKVTKEEMIFEGNYLENVDPYSYLPDPNVSVKDIQRGEYVGWISRDNLTNLLKTEDANDDEYFNVRYLKHLDKCSSTYAKFDESGRETRTSVDTRSDTLTYSGRVDIIYMYIDIIPKEWGLPGKRSGNKNGEYPETWLFGVAGDNVLICARPLNLNHGKKPVVVASPEFDGYSAVPISKLEIINGMQEVLNWLFNSHIINVRKAINDMLIVDPYQIDMKSLRDPAPGKLIPLRRPVWGRGVESAVKQLKIEDITRGNVTDAAAIIEMMKAISGSVDSISGVRRNTSERVTATEVQGEKMSGLSRLERMAKLCSWMAMQDLGYMMASHTQQLMEQDTYVKITGEWTSVLQQEYGFDNSKMKVSPYDILVQYDVEAKDGSLPGSNYSEAWGQLLPVILQDPEIRQSLDVTRIVKHILRSTGAKDVEWFNRPTQAAPQANIMPDQQVQQQVQAGNMIPMEQFNAAAV